MVGKGKRRREKNVQRSAAEKYGFRLPPPPLKSKKGGKSGKDKDIPRSLRKLSQFLQPGEAAEVKKTKNKYAHKHATEVGEDAAWGDDDKEADGEDKEVAGRGAEEAGSDGEDGSDSGGEAAGPTVWADDGRGHDGGDGKAGKDDMDPEARKAQKERERERQKAIERSIKKATGGKLFPSKEEEEQKLADAAHSKRKEKKKIYLKQKKLGKELKRKGYLDMEEELEEEIEYGKKYEHLYDEVGFGETAEKPPQITIRRKGMPGCGDVGYTGARHGKLFADIMGRATSKKEAAKKKVESEARRGGGAKGGGVDEATRLDIISAYRGLKGTQPKTFPAPNAALAAAQMPSAAALRSDAAKAKKARIK